MQSLSESLRNLNILQKPSGEQDSVLSSLPTTSNGCSGSHSQTKSETSARSEGCVRSDDPEAQHWIPKAPDPVPCPYCGKLQYWEGWYFGNGIVQWYTNEEAHPVYCDCEGMQQHLRDLEEQKRKAEEERTRLDDQRRMEERIRKIIGESGMNKRFLERTFETFQITDQNQEAYRTCAVYARKLMNNEPFKGVNSLALIGPVGTGKTHLAAAIANRLLNHGTAVICMTMIDMLARIRDTYRRQSGASEANVVEIYEDVPLLIIDDLGKEAPTDWGVQTIFEIINARYERMLPIVVTTNYNFDRLTDRMVPRGSNDSITAEALVDRLREMCGPVLLTGESWRRRR